MKTLNSYPQLTTRRTLAACFTLFGLAFTIALPNPARAEELVAPRTPANLRVDAPNVPYLEGHAVGTQNYVCLPSGPGVAWVLFTPEATLFSDDLEQVTTHFFGPNPREHGIIRAAWQHSRDTSIVWARVKEVSTDSNFVAKDAVPWVLLEKAGTQAGPTGGDKLTKTTFVQRVNTIGGVAPSSGCSVPADVGHTAFVPYRADYYFYTDPTR